MAGEQEQKTEAPTPRRLERAWEEGQIGFSSDLMAGVALLVATLLLFLFGRQFFGQLKGLIGRRISGFEPMISHPEALPNQVVQAIGGLAGLSLGLLVPLVLTSIVTGGLQTRFNLSFKPLEWKWDRLNPVSGWFRIWSMRSLVRGLSAVLKTVFAGLITYFLIQARLGDVLLTGFMSLEGAVREGANLVFAVGFGISAAMALLGVADLGFQKWRHHIDLRMSHRDIRDERKDDDGDPLMRARMRRLQAELTKKSIAREVPRATVIVTNPTHFAVALKFDRASMAAPVVTAKGSDLMAKRIIELAKEHGIPVVERKPVARFLFFRVKIGQAIPVELYLAIAEIINFIHRR